MTTTICRPPARCRSARAQCAMPCPFTVSVPRRPSHHGAALKGHMASRQINISMLLYDHAGYLLPERDCRVASVAPRAIAPRRAGRQRAVCRQNGGVTSGSSSPLPSVPLPVHHGRRRASPLIHRPVGYLISSCTGSASYLPRKRCSHPAIPSLPSPQPRCRSRQFRSGKGSPPFAGRR